MNILEGAFAPQTRPWVHHYSDPARLGKGQGVKEIGHNLARERTKIRVQFSAQTTQNRAHLRVNDQNLVLWAIDENMGTNLQAYYKHFYIGCLKTQKSITFCKNKTIFFLLNYFFSFLNSGRARVNRAGCKPARAGCSALINMPSWNTALYLSPCLTFVCTHRVTRWFVGYVCRREHTLVSGCCNTTAPLTRRFSCVGCRRSGCCALYEHCVSCCLQPQKVTYPDDLLSTSYICILVSTSINALITISDIV